MANNTSSKVSTPDHFARWEAMAREMSDEELSFAARDAHESAQACAGWDECGESFYRDQAMTFDQEKANRRALDLTG